MKKTIVMALFAAALCNPLSADFSFGVSGSDQGVNSFRLSIGDYYNVPVQEVVYLERSIPQDEISVVYYLAQKSRYSASHISNLRLRGASWWDISLRLGLDPYIVYGHPRHKKNRWRDHEVVDYVNTRFISKYHHISRDEVVSRRDKGERYMQIDKHYRYQQPQYREERGLKNDKHSKKRDDQRNNKYKDKRNDKRGNGSNDRKRDKENKKSQRQER